MRQTPIKVASNYLRQIHAFVIDKLTTDDNIQVLTARYMLKKTGKWILILFAVGIAIEGIRSIPLLFPYPFFAHNMTLGGFTFYANTDFNSTFRSGIKDSIDRIKQSKLYEPSRHHRVFICEKESRYAFFSALAGRNKFSQGINVEPTGNIFISKPFIESIRIDYGAAYANTLLEGSVSHIIAHEVTHTLITDSIGYWKSKKLPNWKKEGYAEYVASQRASLIPDNHAQLAFEFERFLSLDTRSISPIRLHYLESKLLIHYLIHVQNMSMGSIFHDAIDEETVASDLYQWYRDRNTGSN